MIFTLTIKNNVTGVTFTENFYSRESLDARLEWYSLRTSRYVVKGWTHRPSA